MYYDYVVTKVWVNILETVDNATRKLISTSNILDTPLDTENTILEEPQNAVYTLFITSTENNPENTNCRIRGLLKLNIIWNKF